LVIGTPTLIIFKEVPQGLNFNLLVHVSTHIYKHFGEEIGW